MVYNLTIINFYINQQLYINDSMRRVSSYYKIRSKAITKLL